MASFGSKTPVSCLQEYLVSKKMIPHYELVYNGVGTHAPKFTFRVQVGSLWEEGTGRSKQEAKHRAAENMLKSLKIIDDSATKVEEKSQFDQEIVENYVGQLKDLCYSMRYPEPKYYLEETGGPAHNRVFKMICCVSQLQEFGISKTKKQAKQQAAFKMIQHLKEVGGKKITEALAHPESPIRHPEKSSSLTDSEVIDTYHSLKKTTVPPEKADYAAFYKDHYKAYIGLEGSSPTLAKLLTETNVINSENSLKLVQEVANELGVTVSIGKIPTREAGKEFSVITMSITPAVGDIGVDENNAAFNLLHSLICLCNK